MAIDFEKEQKTDLHEIGGSCYAIKQNVNGKVLPLYRDTSYAETEEGMELKREMVVGGRTFIVRSVFPSVTSATPTQKLLRIIDYDLEKK